MRSMPSILGLATEGHHHVHDLTRTVSNDSARRSPAGLPLGSLVRGCEDQRPYQPMRFDLMLKEKRELPCSALLKEMVCR